MRNGGRLASVGEGKKTEAVCTDEGGGGGWRWEVKWGGIG